MKSFYLSIIISLSLAVLALARAPTTIPPKNPNDPETLPAGEVRRALVIGGGLAGLSAALELADRGYLVTIKEKEDRIGGKLFSKPVEIFRNKTFQVEHGFHAWFHNYHQFRDIRQRLAINSNFRVWPKVHFIYKNYKPEVIYSDGPYPLNLFGIIMRSPNLKWSDMFSSSLCLPDLLYFDYDKVFEKYDNLTFAEWAKEKKVAESFYKIIMQPSLSVTLNEQEIFSAAEMLSFMQIYFLTNAKADGREVLTTNFHDGIIQPWLDHLSARNVQVYTSKGVKSLKVNETTLRAYGSVDEDGDDQTVYDSVIMAADVGSVQGIFHETLSKSSPPVASVIQTVLDKHIDRMKLAPNYKVVRVWFDNQLNFSAPDILETPDHNPINLVAQYHLLEKEFAEWASQTGGSVIEFHCYTWSKYFNQSEPLNNTQVWELISPTVKLIYPEIFERKFRVLGIHVNSFQNFASFERGLAKYRPYVDSVASLGLKNVYLAGDWIQTTYPSALMERAVSTGRQAANEVLLSDQVRQATLLVVDKQGPGLWPNDS